MLDHDTHLKKVEVFLHQIRPDFDALQNNQKNSLRSFLYVFSGIFGSTNLPVKSMMISMGSELTIGEWFFASRLLKNSTLQSSILVMMRIGNIIVMVITYINYGIQTF